MKIFLTDCESFVGHHLVRTLVQNKHKVKALVQGLPKDKLLEGDNVELCIGHVNNSETLEVMEGCDAVVHIDDALDKKLTGVKNLLEIAKKEEVPQIIYLSILNTKQATKEQQAKMDVEKLIIASGIPYTILKTAIIYGKGDKTVDHLVKLMKDKSGIYVPGKATLQPLYIDDFTEAIMKSVKKKDKVFCLAGPNRMSTDDFIKKIISAARLDIDHGTKKLFGGVHLSKDDIKFLTTDCTTDNKEAVSELKLKLSEFEPTLRAMYLPKPK